MINNITITKDAINYLKIYVNQEKNLDLIIYISVSYPYTTHSYVNITFCKKSDINEKDLNFKIDDLEIFIDLNSIDLLKDATIDIKDNNLKINAPNLFNKKENNKANIKNEIQILFETEINVILSQHGGFIELIDLENNETLLVKFHGGCQGCGMVSNTLNNYIEKIIKKNFPQIKDIIDITSHEVRTNSYY